ncbi:MAG TPA: RDD family protein [Tepidiformaceae bacterium]
MTAESATPRAHVRGSRTAPSIRHASFEGRVAAGALDLLVLFIIASLLISAGAVVVLISSNFERVDPSATAINIFWVCVVSIGPAIFLYFFVGLAWKGQTVGAAVMQIMVIRSDGRPLGVLGSCARVVGMLLYVLVLVMGIAVAYALRSDTPVAAAAIAVAFVVTTLGFLMAAFDSRRRTLHDRLAGTIVVRLG